MTASLSQWSVVLPGNRLYTVSAVDYVSAIGLALARTRCPLPWGTLCFERTSPTDGICRDIGSGAILRAHRTATLAHVLARRSGQSSEGPAARSPLHAA